MSSVPSSSSPSSSSAPSLSPIIKYTLEKIEEFIQTCIDREKIKRLELYKNKIEKVVNVREIYTESSGTHFESCIWANPTTVEGPDTCECFYIFRAVYESNQLMGLDAELSSHITASSPSLSSMSDSSEAINPSHCLQFLCKPESFDKLMICTIEMLGIIRELLKK